MQDIGVKYYDESYDTGIFRKFTLIGIILIYQCQPERFERNYNQKESDDWVY